MNLLKFPAEAWGAIAAAVGLVTFAAKKLIGPRLKPKPDHITRAEFHQQLDATRDRIAASYLALGEKLDANHRDILQKFDTVESRLDRVDAFVARLDERTTRP